jgi:hypothetical protein
MVVAERPATRARIISTGELLGSTHKLPTSEHSISLLASLDDIAFPKALERLEPDMSQKDALAQKNHPKVAFFPSISTGVF